MMEFLVMLIEQSDYLFVDSDGNHYKPDSYNVAHDFLSHLFEENFHEWVKEYYRVVEEEGKHGEWDINDRLEGV